MNKITEITRKDIFSCFKYGIDINEYFIDKHVFYNYFGNLSEIDFLKRIYDLENMPSYDDRFENAEGDIWQHTVNNDDYEFGWVFEDERFGLKNGKDEVILEFLCSVFHPIVREESGYWKKFLDRINDLLREDGYELYSTNKISGRDVYGWRNYSPEDNALFIPFSQRYIKNIKAKEITLSIKVNVRNQIYKLVEKYSEVFRETDNTGWQYDISTEQCVFRDMSQFYEPKCYDDNGKYVKTTDMESFILKSSPFSVFDFLEFYSHYNQYNDFEAQLNALLTLNQIPYKMNNGKMHQIIDISLSKKDISEIAETGLKDLIMEASSYYTKGNRQLAVEKIWDAFERLKTYYYPKLNKKDSANKIINDMSNSVPEYIEMYESEFSALTKIGNNFRIRHHEKNKIDITDLRQLDYFYKRCTALVSVAILYLKGEKKS